MGARALLSSRKTNVSSIPVSADGRNADGLRRSGAASQVSILDASSWQLGLRPMERRLLAVLEQHRNRAVRSQDIISAVYGNIAFDAGKTRLKRLVADIRARFPVELATRLRTVHGIGLALTVDSDSSEDFCLVSFTSGLTATTSARDARRG